MASEVDEESGSEEESEYPVYEPANYRSQDYPLGGHVSVWDPGCRRTVDAAKSTVPDDSVVLEVDTMFVEREYRLIVEGFETGLVDEPVDAVFIQLGGAYPGVQVGYYIDDESWLAVKRPFTEDSLDMRVREGECPDPESRANVIWVADPADQPALMDTR